MTREELVQLSRIYNTLLSVHTCGEDSFVMTDCMRALYQLVESCSKKVQEGEVAVEEG